MSQTFVTDKIKNIPVFWYRYHMEIAQNMELPKGYVEISEKKFNRESKKRK